jgi:hypothetical protein
MERGPSIDILHSARLTQRNMDVGMTAYFAGPIDGPTVVCIPSTCRPTICPLSSRNR